MNGVNRLAKLLTVLVLVLVLGGVGVAWVGLL